MLQRARWALGVDELNTLKKRAEFFGLDKAKNFEEYRSKYLNAVENTTVSGILKKSRVRSFINTGRWELLNLRI